MASWQLLSTDCEGTLIGHPDQVQRSPDLAGLLRDLHRRRGIWAVKETVRPSRGFLAGASRAGGVTEARRHFADTRSGGKQSPERKSTDG